MTTQTPEIDAITANDWLANGSAILIDVREQDEFDVESITGARLYPLSQFQPEQLMELKDAGKKLVIQCRSGGRSATAAQQLLQAGFGEVYNLAGGILAWKEAMLPIQSA